MIKVTIRDGRVGRDPATVTPDGHGPILETRDCAQPVDENDRLTLRDGTEVLVIGVDDHIYPGRSWEQTAHIGNLLQSLAEIWLRERRQEKLSKSQTNGSRPVSRPLSSAACSPSAGGYIHTAGKIPFWSAWPGILWVAVVFVGLILVMVGVALRDDGDGLGLVDSNGDSNSSGQRQTAATGDSAHRLHDP